MNVCYWPTGCQALFVVLGAGHAGTSKTDVNPGPHGPYSLTRHTSFLFLCCGIGHQCPLCYYVLSQIFLYINQILYLKR